MNGVEGEPTQLIDINEVAKRLMISPQTIRKMAHRGEFPVGIKLGRSRRWRPSDLAIVIEGGKPGK